MSIIIGSIKSNSFNIHCRDERDLINAIHIYDIFQAATTPVRGAGVVASHNFEGSENV